MSVAGFVPDLVNNTDLHRCCIFASKLHFTRVAPSSSAHPEGSKTSQAHHKKDWQQLVFPSAIWKKGLLMRSKEEWNLWVMEGNGNIHVDENQWTLAAIEKHHILEWWVTNHTLSAWKVVIPLKLVQIGRYIPKKKLHEHAHLSSGSKAWMPTTN